MTETTEQPNPGTVPAPDPTPPVEVPDTDPPEEQEEGERYDGGEIPRDPDAPERDTEFADEDN